MHNDSDDPNVVFSNESLRDSEFSVALAAPVSNLLELNA